ncbi:TPA: hypothetical protein EYP66_12000, partial [Candidatus Poribacteria bacterium]|nr:hypothetical protein [Candidatus Poribacteria bacterium]
MTNIFAFGMLIRSAEYGGKNITNFYIFGRFDYVWIREICFGSGWHHWSEGGHDPEKIDQNGYRDIGATNHPDPDVYDSNDPLQLIHCPNCNSEDIVKYGETPD